MDAVVRCQICGHKEPLPKCAVCQDCLDCIHEEWDVWHRQPGNPEDIGSCKVCKLSELQNVVQNLIEQGFYIEWASPRGIKNGSGHKQQQGSPIRVKAVEMEIRRTEEKEDNGQEG